jgi:cytochrome P450
MRDPITGDLTLGDQVQIIGTYDAARSVLYDPVSFPQWDGSFRSADGAVVFADKATRDRALVPIPSLAAMIAHIEAGPFCNAMTPIFLDPPAHTRFRRLLVQDWAIGAAARALTPRVRRIAADVMTRAGGRQPLDFMGSVAPVISPASLALFFGDELSTWVKFTAEHPAVACLPDYEGDGTEVLEPFREHLWTLMSRRRHSPGEDALSRMVQHSQAGDGLTFAEIHTLAVQMAVVANESTMRLLGSVASVLAQSPALRARLRTERAAVPRLVDAVLRQCPPLRGILRRSSRASVAGGTEIAAGKGLFVDFKRAAGPAAPLPALPQFHAGLGQAGHGQNLAFGIGIHRCPGARLARMQAGVVAEVLCNLPAIRIAEGGLQELPRDMAEGPSQLLLEVAAR